MSLMDILGNSTPNTQLILQSDKTDSEVSHHTQWDDLSQHLKEDHFQGKILKAVSN